MTTRQKKPPAAAKSRRRPAQPAQLAPVPAATSAATAVTKTGATRLIPPLPAGAFVAEPEEIDRFVVRVLEDGSLYFKGSRPRIEEFLAACAEVGLAVHVNHIALCG